MTREQRLRRVLLVCCQFARNMAYYRAGWQRRSLIKKSDFWKSINGNCIDIAVLEWCKLFAEPRGLHYWSAIVSDRAAFETGLLDSVGPGWSRASFDIYVARVRTYRNKFVAHLDNDLIASIPDLEDCWKSTHYYHSYIVSKESLGISLHHLPQNLDAYYQVKFKEAAVEYGREDS